MDIHAIIEIIESNQGIKEMLAYCPYEILRQWEIKQYQKGDIIGRQGHVYNYFAIIVAGYVDIYSMSESGKTYSQAIYSKGNYIGELEIFDKRPFICFTQALTDVKLIQLDRKYYLQWLEMDKHINSYLMRTLCTQFYNLSRKAGEDTLYTLRQRICRYLCNQARQNDSDNRKPEIVLDKTVLSERFAVTNRSINRIIQQLRNEEIIDVKNGRILIKNLKKLAYFN